MKQGDPSKELWHTRAVREAHVEYLPGPADADGEEGLGAAALHRKGHRAGDVAHGAEGLEQGHPGGQDSLMLPGCAEE